MEKNENQSIEQQVKDQKWLITESLHSQLMELLHTMNLKLYSMGKLCEKRGSTISRSFSHKGNPSILHLLRCLVPLKLTLQIKIVRLEG